MDHEFALRLYHAMSDWERQYNNGNPVNIPGRDILGRDSTTQAYLYQRYMSGQGGLAAPPGHSRHEYGQAADIPRGPLLDWLHANAGKYGLEFLPGWNQPNNRGTAFDKDQVHIQLARGPNGEMPARYQLPEQFFVDQARARTMARFPNANPDLVDSVIARTTADFRQQRSEENNRIAQNDQIVRNEFVRQDGTPPPKSIEELLARPGIRQAWDNLGPKQQLYYNRKIYQDTHEGATPEQYANYRQLKGMSLDINQLQKFVDTDLSKVDLTEKNKYDLIDMQTKIRDRHYVIDQRVTHALSELQGSLPPSLTGNTNQYNLFKGAMADSIEAWQKRPENIGKIS